MRWFVFMSTLLLYSCLKYDNPLTVRNELVEKMKGDYRVTELKNQDTLIYDFCTFTLTGEEPEADPEIFPKIYFDNILGKHSKIFQYFCQAYCLYVPPDYSGRSYIFWDPDVYGKRINLWAIAGFTDLHKVVNREIISKKKEKWWLVIDGGLEEIYIEKL